MSEILPAEDGGCPDTSGEPQATVETQSRVILLSAPTIADLRGLRYVKIRSASAVNQTADPTINMPVRQGA